jgi:hypothetical protein
MERSIFHLDRFTSNMKRWRVKAPSVDLGDGTIEGKDSSVDLKLGTMEGKDSSVDLGDGTIEGEGNRSEVNG